MKRTCAIILALTMLFSLALGARAQTAQAITGMTASAGYGVAENKQEYTNPQQITQLLKFIPPEHAPLVSVDSKAAAEGLAVALSFKRNGVPEQWIFYNGYCRRVRPSGMADWRFFSKEAWQALLIMSGRNLLEASGKPAYYKGERVTALYSLEGRYCSYQPIPDFQKLLPLLEKTPPNTTKEPASLGFLLFTDKAKYTWSFSYNNVSGVRPLGEVGSAQRSAWEQAVRETTKLNMLSALYNEAPWGRHAQWLVYMSEEKIESVSFSGLGGAGYSNAYHPEAGVFGIGVDTKDRESIHKIASFLKTIEVSPAPRVYSGPDNPLTVTGLIDMRIKFNTGVEYRIFGYDKTISIYASELDGTVVYDVSQQQTNALRDLMALLPEASLNPITF